jgi:hypothetical protein
MASFGITGHQTRNWEWKFSPNDITGTQPKLVFRSILVANWVSWFILSFPFFLSASTAATYIFTAPTCTTTIITLKLCALNAEFQHFILIFLIIKFLTLQIPRKESVGGESRPKERVTLPITLMGNLNTCLLPI